MSARALTIEVDRPTEVRARTDNGGSDRADIEVSALSRDTIKVFSEWLNQGKFTRRREFEVLGRHLYETIFTGQVGTFFQRELGLVPAGERMRLQLSFGEDAGEMAAWPWEYLYNPDSKRFFATDVDIVLSRFVRSTRAVSDAEQTETPLRVLLVAAEPRGGAFERTQAEFVIKVIQKLTEQHPINLNVLMSATIDDFLDQLRDYRPHVLHFIGQGRYNRQNDCSEIALLNDAGIEHWIDDRRFADFFVQMRCYPQLVFIHLWETDHSDFDASFATIAPSLVRNNIQSVIAMQYPITSDAAIAFCKHFYEELVTGAPVDHAVQEGRWRMTLGVDTNYDSRMFGSPMLFMRSNNCVLVPKLAGETAGGFPGTSPLNRVARTPQAHELAAATRSGAHDGGGLRSDRFG